MRVKGFKIFNDRHGKPRCYHRATNIAVDLEKCPIGSPEFIAECQRIVSLSSGPENAKPGSLGALIGKYRDHAQFQDLAPRTRSDYQKIFNYLQPISDSPLRRFNAPLVVKLRDAAAAKMGRRWGDYTKTVLSVVFSWGVERGFIEKNPAANIKGIRRPKGAEQANRPWKDYEREAVLDAMPAHLLMPLNLMMFCGLDPSDALSLPRSALKDGLIDTKRSKTGEPVWIPIPQPVEDALIAMPEHNAITVCANSRGKPWTLSGFSSSWIKERNKLLSDGKIEAGLTLKGLRHTVATILAEMGMDDRTIADMLGQRTIAMAQHYSRRANRGQKLTGVVAKFDEEVNKRRSKVVKP